MHPDVVYVMGPHVAREDSLRYSLRSLAVNGAPYRKVWIVGTVPSWVRGVERLPLMPLAGKFENQRQSLEAVCACDEVADAFVLFNDDHFVTDPLGDGWPVYRLGPASEYVSHLRASSPRNTWVDAVASTAQWMTDRGYGDIPAYEAHVPLPFDRRKLGALLTEYPRGMHLAVGEMFPGAGIGGPGIDAGNAKVKFLDPAEFFAKVALPLPFLSSNAETFGSGLVGGYVRGLFRHPSRYES